MIVRIMGEGQFDVPSSFYDELNRIDNVLVEMVSKGDRAGFRAKFDELLRLIRAKGKLTNPSDIVESDLIVPPAEITLEEAHQIFRGHGLLRD